MQIRIEGAYPPDDHPLHHINLRQIPSAKIEESDILFLPFCDQMEQGNLNNDDQCIVHKMKERLSVKYILVKRM